MEMTVVVVMQSGADRGPDCGLHRHRPDHHSGGVRHHALQEQPGGQDGQLCHQCQEQR